MATTEPKVLDLVPGSEEWHASWATHLHATDVAAILGHHPWKTQLDVWGRLTGELDPREDETEEMEWGKRLEAVCALKWEEETEDAELLDIGVCYQSAELPFLIITPDRLISPIDATQPTGVWEGKTGSAWKLSDWDDGMPITYQIQLQVYLWVTRMERGAYGALIGGNRWRSGDHIAPNVAFHKQIDQKLRRWWDKHIEGGVMPEPNERDMDLLKSFWPRHMPGKVVTLGEDECETAEEWQDAKQQSKSWEKRAKAAQAKLIAAMGDAERAVVPGADFDITYKSHTRHEKPRPARDIEVRMMREVKP